MPGDFYIRYYVGHKGKFGHEFLEFEFRPDGEWVEGEVEVLRWLGRGEMYTELRGQRKWIHVR